MDRMVRLNLEVRHIKYSRLATEDNPETPVFKTNEALIKWAIAQLKVREVFYQSTAKQVTVIILKKFHEASLSATPESKETISAIKKSLKEAVEIKYSQIGKYTGSYSEWQAKLIAHENSLCGEKAFILGKFLWPTGSTPSPVSQS